MADNIVFTQKQGSGGTFTLFSAPRGVGSPTNGLAWKTMEIVSPSPWTDVVYAGFSGADQKYMGGKPSIVIVTGYAYDLAESDIFGEISVLLTKNKNLDTWTVSGAYNSFAEGVVIGEIVTGPHGVDTGFTWPFRLTFLEFVA